MNDKTVPPEKRMPWGALFWTVPLLYIFLDPYKRHAHWSEWLLTGIGFVIFLCLYVAGWMSASDARRLRKICVGVLVLAMAFMAYRPNGAIFFPLVAAFAPFTVGGNIPWSAALIAGVLGIFGLEWWLVDPGGRGFNNAFPFVLGAETLLISAGTTFVARQIGVVGRFYRVTERERIARDLHDVLGQTLSSIALKAELAGRLFHQNPQRALAEIGDVERISRQALDEVRQAIQGYHAGDIQSEFDRAESMLQTAGIAVERRHGEIDLAPAQERVLALVLREAVTNVVRHAQARSCRLALHRANEAYRLEIHDDGRGGEHHEGIGMSSIRTRVEALGGSATWSGGSGTQLTITLPVAAKPERE